jgi:hypothetical protein
MKKTRINVFQGLTAALLSMAAGAGLLPLAAQPTATAPAPKLDAQSVFTSPENRKQGRDPFFPDSNRPYQDVSNPSAIPTGLKLIGISGVPNHRLAIINNHTFGIDDEEQVTTSQGKVLVHCLEIGEHSVVVEANGQRIELVMSDNQ